MPGYAVFLSMWALVRSGIALMPSAHHQLFTRSWQPISPPCKIWEHGGLSMQHNGENSFQPFLPQSHQRILTSLCWQLCYATYAVLFPQWLDGTFSLLPQTSAVKQTSQESSTSEIQFTLTLKALLLILQHLTNSGRKSGTLYND